MSTHSSADPQAAAGDTVWVRRMFDVIDDHPDRCLTCALIPLLGMAALARWPQPYPKDAL